MTRKKLLLGSWSDHDVFCGECGDKTLTYKHLESLSPTDSFERGRRICPFCGGFIHRSCAAVHNKKHKDAMGIASYNLYLNNLKQEGIPEDDICCTECGEKLLKHAESSHDSFVQNLGDGIIITCEFCGGYVHNYCKNPHYAMHKKSQ
jgi:hypothetical protein